MLPVTTTRMRRERAPPELCTLGWHLCQHPLCGALRGHADADIAWTPLSFIWEHHSERLHFWAWKVQSSCGKEIIYSLKLKKREKLYSEWVDAMCT